MALNLKDALKVLLNGLPPSPPPETVEIEVEVEKVILVEGKPLDLYRAVDVVHQEAFSAVLSSCFVWTRRVPEAAKWHGKHYTTCEAAFAAAKGAKVEVVRVPAILSGGVYYRRAELSEIKVEPKPKKAKGR